MKSLEQKLLTLDIHTDKRGLGLPTQQTSPAAVCADPKEVTIPSALVISGDETVGGVVGEALLLCGAAPVFARTLEQASRHIREGKVRLGICQDRLPDGRYKEVLLMQHAFESTFPLIVVSRTGDWPEYFEALDLGASDFLAYPLIPGELQRIVQELMKERHPSLPKKTKPPQERALRLDAGLDQLSSWRSGPSGLA